MIFHPDTRGHFCIKSCHLAETRLASLVALEHDWGIN
jgi:hypothetical protein